MPGMNFLHRLFNTPSKILIVLDGRAFILLLLVLNMAILLLAVPQSADAARRRVIFQLANLRQWTDFEYTYDGRTFDSQQGDDRTAQEHEFEESYHLGVDYAILSHRLANGTLELDLGLNQNYESESGAFDRNDSSAGLNLEYLFDMLLFERRFYPITLLANQLQEQVNAPFSQNYDLTSSNYSAGISLRNDVLPTQFSYRHYATETDGLSRDRNQTSDELTLDATSVIGEISTTGLQARSVSRSSHVEGSATATEIDSYELEGKNTLSWTAYSHHQTLYSSCRLQRDTGSSEMRTKLWDERLDLELGKALEAELSYSQNDTESSLQDRQEKKWGGWIEHRLFKSLTSRYQHNISQTNYDNGEDQNWRHQLSFNYTKELPKQSRLDLSYAYGYGETDRNLDDQQLFAIDEELTVQLDNNYLVNPDIIESSVLVHNADRSLLYTEGIDYQLVAEGRRLELVFFLPFPTPNGINLADTLSIDYAYRVNSSIEYSTTSNSVSASIGLFNQRYRLYANLSQTDQELIDGVADVSPLTQTTFAQVGFEGNPGKFSYGSSYQYQDTSISIDKTLEAYVNYKREKNRTLLNLRLTERHITTQQNEGLSSTVATTSSRNSLLLNVDYRMQLARNTTMNLRGHIIDLRGDNRDQDDVFLGVLFESRWYKFQVRVSADVTWQIYDQSTSRNDRVTVGIRRYF